MKSVSSANIDFSQLERALRARTEKSSELATPDAKDSNSSFFDMLTKSIQEVNGSVKESENIATDIATGKSTNIHEAMLAATKAEIGFNLLVQMRNKAIEAYQEVMRMQV